ncbi:MAG: ThiF family adenylyltransferase [Calditrichaeota bacterium]|nr:ThiF family adenylyltransferase [Calditrichota bacterium]
MDLSRFVRQQDAVDMERLSSLDVTMIGLGAIGSTCAVWLGKMGCASIQAFDGDRIEPQNWSNQMYSDDQIGMLKADALGAVMKQFAGQRPTAIAEFYSGQPVGEVVISGVDSMKSRMDIWRGIRDQTNLRLYVDARMGLDTVTVYTVRNQVRDDRVTYSKTLHTDAESVDLPCTARAVAYSPLACAAIICNLVKRYVNNEQLPHRVILDLATWTLVTN